MRIIPILCAAALALASFPAAQAEEDQRMVVEQTTIIMCPEGVVKRQIDCTPRVARLIIVCGENVVFAPCPHWSERSTANPIQWSAQFSESGFGGARVVVVRTVVPLSNFKPYNRLAAWSQ